MMLSVQRTHSVLQKNMDVYAKMGTGRVWLEVLTDLSSLNAYLKYAD